jgi:phosphomevalonate kinase
MKKKVLALSGKRFVGKDTFAAMLAHHAKERAGVTMHVHAFAMESKRMFVAQEAMSGVDVDLSRLQIDREYKEHWRPKLTAFTVQSIAADPLVFCKSVADRIQQENEASLIADVRLRLEVEHLRPRFDLHLVRIERSNDARATAGWSYNAAADEHHTETELDDPGLWDECIQNNGTLEELAAKAVAIIHAWLPLPT